MNTEAVRSYLLGTVDEPGAASIEERYFTDRGFFLFVKTVETALIEDYLAGRLPDSLRSRFEQRYLRVPELRSRLEEIRNRRSVAPAQAFSAHQARFLMAAAILLFCVGGAVLWFYFDHSRLIPLSTPKGPRPVLATITLSPGLMKGEVSTAGRLVLKPGSGDVQILLELPGQAQSAQCLADISIAPPNGGWNRIWSTPRPVWSTHSPGGQQVAILVDSSLLVRGDYLVEVIGVDSQVRETYTLRVSLN